MNKYFAIIAITLLSAGCGFAPPYLKVENALHSGNFTEAAKAVDDGKSNYGDKSLLLFYFDRAWTRHLAGDYTGSNEDVESAAKLIDELYTESVTGNALAFLGNDMSLPYDGENFERVMLHTVGMLNYAMLGKTDEALVEAKRADARLVQYSEKAGKDKVVYQQDALSRYLSATLYESEGGQSRWDAFLDYKKCDEAFGIYARAYGTAYPSLLKSDLLRISKKISEKEAYQGYFERFGSQPLDDTKDKGQVLVLLYEGLAPEKVTERVDLPVHLSEGTLQYFSAAFPRFVPRLTGYASAKVSADGGDPRPLELFQDVQSIAIQDLNDRVALIRVKAIARATAKFQAARALQQEAKKQGGEGAQLLAMIGTNLYGLISEQADTRSWRTLPGRISLTRLNLEPGKHHVTLTVTLNGQLVTKEFENVDVKAGKVMMLEFPVY